jgi:hypothetical protein
MSTTTAPKSKIVTVPEFTVGGMITATVPATELRLERHRYGTKVFCQKEGYYEVELGVISADGGGWTAMPTWTKIVGSDRPRPEFFGSHYPRRTGKHTQTYALAYLLARAAGFSHDAAAYDVRYEGVSA